MKQWWKIKFLSCSWKEPVAVVIYLQNSCICTTNTIQMWQQMSKQGLWKRDFRKDIIHFGECCYSDHPLSTSDKTEFVKTKLREKLQINDSKLNTSSSTETSNATDGTDYFQLIYECIHTRRVYLNFINLKLHSPTEADLDLAILQALLNGYKLHLQVFN